MRLVSEMAKARRSLPILERCERPKVLLSNKFISNPGCFLHGPEENSGFTGLTNGAELIILEVQNFPENEVQTAVDTLILLNALFANKAAVLVGNRIIVTMIAKSLSFYIYFSIFMHNDAGHSILTN
mmetsp:Transcript_21167/g.29653  ORF Transcript_21167/g.29653 Transcript_21167/m.29653 type:complete len:127 (-) Transcript_21167:17-397(-)